MALPSLSFRALAVALGFLLFIGYPVQAQQAELDSIGRLLEEGEVNQLVELAADRIEIRMPDRGGLYSRGQAAFVVRDFWNRHKPLRIEYTDTAAENAHCFASGTVTSGDGATMALFIRLKREGDHWQLRELYMEER